MRLRWTDASLRNLATIRAHVAADDPVAADRMVRRINEATRRLLLDVAYAGRRGRVEDTWELVVLRTPYIVVHRRSGDDIDILRVLHGAQRWPPSS